MSDKNCRNSLISWRKTLDRLTDETGISLADASEYIGAAGGDGLPGFYLKLPRKRSTYIGVGMAFKQPADVINQWISEYTGKRRLYVKDISEDLVWLYLINANLQDTSGSINYYSRYEEYQSVAYAVFSERWDEFRLRFEDTGDVEISLGQAEYGSEYNGIRDFVAEHMDAFSSAYSKPRAYLDSYLQHILRTSREDPEQQVIQSLNSMRGWLDDSMINFLSGDSDTFIIIDRKTGRRSIKVKRLPKNRRKYISICMALGMTTTDIDMLLDMMGYNTLDDSNPDEERLIEALGKWENSHMLQRAYKDLYFNGDESVELDPEEEYRAVRQMLQLRTDLAEMYRGKDWEFIYM